MSYQPAPDRYERMFYQRSGRSGLLLPLARMNLDYVDICYSHRFDPDQQRGAIGR